MSEFKILDKSDLEKAFSASYLPTEYLEMLRLKYEVYLKNLESLEVDIEDFVWPISDNVPSEVEEPIILGHKNKSH